ncbi:hypothetical protein MAR_003819 [Mya arenaria]|uniref:Uncharacterized protein n=1 Tax=Mya arenaria TaxID=6604 RepID=A0ABY7EZ52_MYAAR|nr:hypothetical protein MAR_003819 [Mya arenaria]
MSDSQRCAICNDHTKRGEQLASTLTVKGSDMILTSCNERGDAWADIVKGIVFHVHDLHAADAVYHQVCSVNIRTKKQMPADHRRTSETEVKNQNMVGHKNRKKIIQTDINRKANVLTFRSTAKAILNDFYAYMKADPETEKKQIIETAAKLIKDDI